MSFVYIYYIVYIYIYIYIYIYTSYIYISDEIKIKEESISASRRSSLLTTEMTNFSQDNEIARDSRDRRSDLRSIEIISEKITTRSSNHTWMSWIRIIRYNRKRRYSTILLYVLWHRISYFARAIHQEMVQFKGAN